MTDYLEIIVKHDTDVFKVVEQLKKEKRIRASVIDWRMVRLRFNADRISSSDVVKLFNKAIQSVKQTGFAE